MFNKFCEDKNIRGNFKEALYHHLAAKYAEYDNPILIIDQLKYEEYEKEWKVVLGEIYRKLMENNTV